MSELRLEQLFYPGAVSFLASLQLARFARRVGEARRRYKVPPPKTDGDPNFTRVYRAQQNTLEFHPIFMTLLWISSIFFHNAVPSFFGLIYLCARHKYFYGYSQASEERLPGFRLSFKVIMVLFLLTGVGLLDAGYTKYTGEKVDMSLYHAKAAELANPVIEQANVSYQWASNKTAPYVKAARINIEIMLDRVQEVAENFVQNMKVVTDIMYSKACLFTDWLVSNFINVAMYLAEQFASLKRSISTYFNQSSSKQEL